MKTSSGYNNKLLLSLTFVSKLSQSYIYGICCCYIIFLCTLGNVLPFLYTLNQVENKMDILPYRGNHGHSTNKRFALKKPAELTNSTRRHLENLFRANLVPSPAPAQWTWEGGSWVRRFLVDERPQRLHPIRNPDCSFLNSRNIKTNGL